MSVSIVFFVEVSLIKSSLHQKKIPRFGRVVPIIVSTGNNRYKPSSSEIVCLSLQSPKTFRATALKVIGSGGVNDYGYMTLLYYNIPFVFFFSSLALRCCLKTSDKASSNFIIASSSKSPSELLTSSSSSL